MSAIGLPSSRWTALPRCWPRAGAGCGRVSRRAGPRRKRRRTAGRSVDVALAPLQ